MTKKTRIKIALLGSLVSLVICVGILVGVSYAFDKIDSTQSVKPYNYQYSQGSEFPGSRLEDYLKEAQRAATRSSFGYTYGSYVPGLLPR